MKCRLQPVNEEHLFPKKIIFRLKILHQTLLYVSLDEVSVKQTIGMYLAKMPVQREFFYYHLYRNYFNVKNEVTRLEAIKNHAGYFIDNLGKVWHEEGISKNFFHMPKGNWLGSMVGLTKPYSRKFLRDDTGMIGGEFEMIIRYDGKRIDALTDVTYQETYNFGRTRYTSQHLQLDVLPHKIMSNYTFRQNTGMVTIIE